MRIYIPKIDPINIYNTSYGSISQYNCLASENEYIPVISLTQGQVISNSKKRDFLYSLIQGIVGNNFSQFVQFCDILHSSPYNDISGHGYNLMSPYRLQRTGFPSGYEARYGTMIHKDVYMNMTPLMLLCVKTKYLFAINRDNPNPDHFCLVIDKRFIEDENHSKVYRNVKKYYIDPMSEVVDIVTTRNILEICFNQKVIKENSFNTLDELMEHTKGITEILLSELAEIAVGVDRPETAQAELDLMRDLSSMNNTEQNSILNDLRNRVGTNILSDGTDFTIFTAGAATNSDLQSYQTTLTTSTIPTNTGTVLGIQENEEDTEEYIDENYDDEEEYADSPEEDTNQTISPSAIEAAERDLPF